MTSSDTPPSLPPPFDPPFLTRRQWLLLGGASTVVGATAGAWWHGRSAKGLGDPSMQVDPRVWTTPLAGLDGSPLLLASLAGRPLLINFWATWCPPCVEEMPLIDAFFQKQGANGVQVMAIAVDQPEPVGRFVRQNSLNLPVAIGGMAGIELSRWCGNLTGGLPFSILFDAQQQVVQRKIGKLTPDDLALWTQKYSK